MEVWLDILNRIDNEKAPFLWKARTLFLLKMYALMNFKPVQSMNIRKRNEYPCVEPPLRGVTKLTAGPGQVENKPIYF